MCVSAPLSTNSSPLSPLLSEMMSLSLVTSHLSVSPTQIISTSWLRYKHPPAESRSHWSLMSNGSHLTSSLYSGRHHREPVTCMSDPDETQNWCGLCKTILRSARWWRRDGASCVSRSPYTLTSSQQYCREHHQQILNCTIASPSSFLASSV